MTSHVDIVVLGAGPGGYVAAIRAAQLGLSVTVIEEQYWGGVCLNVGCIPSKALLRNADLAHTFTHKADLYGMSGNVTFDYGAAWDRSRSVSEGHVKGIHYLMRKNGITEFTGKGTFIDEHTIEVVDTDGSASRVSFDHAIIATGSTVRLLPGVELSENVVTFKERILDRDLPESIVIVGAGAIGMEFAYILVNFGVKVTIIEFLDRLLPNEDADVSAELQRQYKKYGIDILTSTRVDSINNHGDSVTVAYTDKEGLQGSIVSRQALMSVGFAPNTTGYGLEKLDIARTDGGAIAIDEYMRTNVPHIFAIGDVTAKLQLAHVAEAQGIVAAETIAGIDATPLDDYRDIPRATFCSPQVASFGLTEQQAREEGYDVKVASFPFSANGKANALGEPVGFVKVIADAKHLEILGGHLVGPDVSELLPELTLIRLAELTAWEAAQNIHVHPTLSEALQEAFHGLTGHMINA